MRGCLWLVGLSGGGGAVLIALVNVRGLCLKGGSTILQSGALDGVRVEKTVEHCESAFLSRLWL